MIILITIHKKTNYEINNEKKSLKYIGFEFFLRKFYNTQLTIL